MNRRWTVFAKYDVDLDPDEETLEFEGIEADTEEEAVDIVRGREWFDVWAWDMYAREEKP